MLLICFIPLLPVFYCDSCSIAVGVAREECESLVAAVSGIEVSRRCGGSRHVCD